MTKGTALFSMRPAVAAVTTLVVSAGLMAAGPATPHPHLVSVAGDGASGFLDGPVDNARFNGPTALARVEGGLLVADRDNSLLRKVAAGDVAAWLGVPPNAAPGQGLLGIKIRYPQGLGVAADGAVVVSDSGSDLVRKIEPDGSVMPILGTGTAGFGGDGFGTSMAVNMPTGIAVTPTGAVYVSDTLNHRVIKVDGNGAATTVAGTGTPGFAGDGGTATSAELSEPTGLALAKDGTLVIADSGNHRIRAVDAATGRISTLAGDGEEASDGDGGPAAEASFMEPTGVAVDDAGAVLVADPEAGTVRRITNGRVELLAGNGEYASFNPDVAAPESPLREPAAVLIGQDSSVYIADRADQRVLQLLPGEAPPPAPDVTGPKITVNGVAERQVFVEGSDWPAPTCSAEDPSGVPGGCQISGFSRNPGEHTLLARAVDGVGNVSQEQIVYGVAAKRGPRGVDPGYVDSIALTVPTSMRPMTVAPVVDYFSAGQSKSMQSLTPQVCSVADTRVVAIRAGRCVVRRDGRDTTVVIRRGGGESSQARKVTSVGSVAFPRRVDTEDPSMRKAARQLSKSVAGMPALIVGHRGGALTNPDVSPSSLSRAKTLRQLAKFPVKTTGVSGAGGYWPGMNKRAASVLRIG